MLAAKEMLTNGGKCFDCHVNIPEFLVKTLTNTFGICPKCVKHYQEHYPNGEGGFAVEPLKPVENKPKPVKIPAVCDYCVGNGETASGKNNLPVFEVYNNTLVTTRFLCAECLEDHKNGSFIKNSTITPLNPYSGQPNMPEIKTGHLGTCFNCSKGWPEYLAEYCGKGYKTGIKYAICPICVPKMQEKPHWNIVSAMKKPDMPKPAKEIPEFCDTCKTKPPNFSAVHPSYPDSTGFVCQHCYDLLKDNGGYLSQCTITPLGDSTVEQQSLPGENPEYGQVQKFDDPQEHKKAAKNKFFCEQDFVTGFDGTQKHFGECYHLESKSPYIYKIACDNHAGVHINEGCVVYNYGKEVGVTPEKGIPDCLLPYIPNYTIDNCWFRVNKKENYEFLKEAWGYNFGLAPACNGPKAGTLSGISDICKTHWDFVEKANKIGNFGSLQPLEKVQKMEIPELVCKIKWNETSGNGGLTTKSKGECEGEWYVVTKIGGVTPSFSFDYEGYSCFPVCEKHKGIFKGQVITPVSEVASGKIPKIKKPAKPKMPKAYTVRTQKAKGLQALKDTYFPVPGFQIFDVKETNPDVLVGKFVRPCPMRPRHGFVDSRTVTSREDADKIIKETLAADPDAEFLLMDYVPAPFSGIWTPGYLAIGQGTDGATAGKTAITIPIMGDFLAKSDSARAKKLASIESAPYVEILWRKMHQEYQGLTVQLRDGPKLPEDAEDYIPGEFTVENIIHADGDLLEWEEKMRHVPANTVVWHPNGTMASHYAIHAVLNKVPLLITREPKVGEVLKPTENLPGEVNIDLMRAGFQIACEVEINYQQAAYFMLLGCHQTGQWLGKYDILLGAAMGFSYRLAMTAALGEERHYNSSKSSKDNRDAVYTRFWKKADTQTGRAKFMDALEKFLNGHLWPGGNYGGKAWYNFTSQAVVVYNSLIKKDHKTAMEAMNQLIHAAHNSGWGFNKFISQSEMTRTAKNPIYSGFHVGPYLYEILTASNETVKSAARSFWKRKPLELPVDKGTGKGKAKTINKIEDEDYDEEDHESACDDEDCEACHPKPPHVFSESCECEGCKKMKWSAAGNTKQTITQAHVKVIWGKQSGKNVSIAHIQYKSEACPDGLYWTKDIKPAPAQLQEMYKKKIGEHDTSYAGSGTLYLVMEKVSKDVIDVDGIATGLKFEGWGVNAPAGDFVKLLDLEVAPNAS